MAAPCAYRITAARQRCRHQRSVALQLQKNQRLLSKTGAFKPQNPHTCSEIRAYVTSDLLKDVLPIDVKLNPDTIRRHLGRVAMRMEADLADERYSFIETIAHQRAELPNPEGQITVGIDGGYVRSRDPGQSHFEVTVGKSIPTDRLSRYLGLVQSHDDKPKRRLHEVLKDQGWQENQPVTFNRKNSRGVHFGM